MTKTIARAVANSVVVVGLFLLVRVLYQAVTGSLTATYFVDSSGTWLKIACALGLSLPVPFHVISVGWIVQRKWLAPRWGRVAWLAVVVSGCWLGAALGIRLLLLH